MKGLYLFIANLVLAIFAVGNVYADTTYVIKKGDNPSTLARKFKVSPHEIVRVNGLKADNLKPGTRITIPSKKKEASFKAEGKIAKSKDKNLRKGKEAKNFSDDIKKASRSEDASVHAVKKGETLLTISKKYALPVNELKEMNNLRAIRLKVGQRIIVKQSAPKTYTVKKGDTIWKISRKFNLDAEELMDMNGLETDSLKPGSRILLAAEPEVKEPKNYDAILSQAHIEKDVEKISESKEIVDLGLRDRLTLFAKKLLNIPYRFGGNSLFGIDCSAYVKRVYSLIGVDLPRSARQQFNEGKAVNGEDLSIGDLVFFRTYASFPSHVGIYLGNNLFIHASSRSRKVTIDSLDTPYYIKRFIGAKRLLDVKDAEAKEDPEKQG